MIFGGQSNPGDYHCNAFDEESIKRHLHNAGFNIIDFQEVDTPQTNGYINLNMTIKAVKKINIEQFNIHPSTSLQKNNQTLIIKEIDGKSLNIV